MNRKKLLSPSNILFGGWILFLITKNYFVLDFMLAASLMFLTRISIFFFQKEEK